MPRPTVGRIVHYYAHPDYALDLGMIGDRRDSLSPKAAIVAGVFVRSMGDPELIDCRLSLAVFDASGLAHSRQIVPFIDAPFTLALAQPNPDRQSFAAWPDRE